MPEDPLEDVWKALAHPLRRAMLDRLREGPLTTGELSEQYPTYSRFAVMQHLKVLEMANLVLPRKDGRRRYNYLNPVPIQQIYSRWVSGYMQPWTEALVGLKHTLEARSDESA
jgi:DNA-binding transcriptional ArsR family regulator